MWQYCLGVSVGTAHHIPVFESTGVRPRLASIAVVKRCVSGFRKNRRVCEVEFSVMNRSNLQNNGPKFRGLGRTAVLFNREAVTLFTYI